MNKRPTGSRVDEVYTGSVDFLFGSVVGPSPSRRELSRSVQLFCSLMSSTFPLRYNENNIFKILLEWLFLAFFPPSLVVCKYPEIWHQLLVQSLLQKMRADLVHWALRERVEQLDGKVIINHVAMRIFYNHTHNSPAVLQLALWLPMSHHWPCDRSSRRSRPPVGSPHWRRGWEQYC